MNSYTLITGASSGIGRATAQRLAKEHRNLILVARRQDALQDLAQEVSTYGIDVRIHPLDVTHASALDSFFDTLHDVSVDAVVNNAGKALGKDSLEDISMDDAHGMIDVNITAFLHVICRSIPLLKTTHGHLVNVGSIAGLEVYEGGVTYCATKHFVHAVSKGLRLDLLGSGIRVTEIAPGAVDTEFSMVRFKGDLDRVAKVYEGYEPLHAEDIADAIWYALSRPKHVNIQHMVVMATAQASATRVAKQ